MTVLEEVRQIALTDDNVDQIADRIMEMQNADLPHTEIKRIQGQINDFQKRIDNLLSAVEEGLKMSSVKDRIDDYEKKVVTLTDELNRLKLKKPLIPRTYLVEWLKSFRSGDTSDDDFCKRLIQTFIEKIIVYPEESCVVLNISGSEEGAQCSNLLHLVNQTKQYSNTGLEITLPYALLWIRGS